ncbi:LPXTG cell wall anchor domain-containing protein [Thermophilibacter sp.]
MNKSTKRNIAVTAGLTAVLALSPVAGPLATALADEATPDETTAVEQTVDTETTDAASNAETPDPTSFCATDWNWFKGEWHYGNWWLAHVKHPVVDRNHDGFCDICWGWIGKPGCDKPGQGGGTEEPGEGGETEQQETLTVIFHFADGTVTTINVETPVGQQVAFQTFVDELDDQYDGITWYWTNFDNADEVLSSDLIGGAGSHVVNVYEHKAETEEPGSGTEEPENPGEGENPGTEEPGGETEEPGTEEPGEGENPGTEEPGGEQPGTEEPGDDTGIPGDDNTDAETPADDATDAGDQTTDTTDKSDDTAKKSDDTKSAKKDALPSTGDATMAVSGIAALGTAVAGLGAFLKRRH